VQPLLAFVRFSATCWSVGAGDSSHKRTELRLNYGNGGSSTIRSRLPRLPYACIRIRRRAKRRSTVQRSATKQPRDNCFEELKHRTSPCGATIGECALADSARSNVPDRTAHCVFGSSMTFWHTTTIYPYTITLRAYSSTVLGFRGNVFSVAVMSIAVALA
jgi:hypothetical protein